MQNGARRFNASQHSKSESVNTERVAFSPREFGAKLGRSPSTVYRLLYSQKLRCITEFGRILIPASELDRILGTAEPYNPELSHSENSKEQLAAAR
jgi:hypothetical protein